MSKLFGNIPAFTSHNRRDTAHADKTKAELQRPKKAQTRTPRPESVPLQELRPRADRFQPESSGTNQSGPGKPSKKHSLTFFPRLPADYGDPYSLPGNSLAVERLNQVKARDAKQFEAPKNTGWSFSKVLQSPIRWIFSLWGRKG